MSGASQPRLRLALVAGGTLCATTIFAISILTASNVPARTEMLTGFSRRGITLAGAPLPPSRGQYGASPPVPPSVDDDLSQFDTSAAEADVDATLAKAEARIKQMYEELGAKRAELDQKRRASAAEREDLEAREAEYERKLTAYNVERAEFEDEQTARTQGEDGQEAERLIESAKELAAFKRGLEEEAAALAAREESFKLARASFEKERAAFEQEQDYWGRFSAGVEAFTMNRELPVDAPFDADVAAAGAAASQARQPAVDAAVLRRGERVLRHLGRTGAWPAVHSGSAGQHVTTGKSSAGAGDGSKAVAMDGGAARHPRRPAKAAVAAHGAKAASYKGRTGAGGKPWFSWSGLGVKLQASWQPGHAAWYAELPDHSGAGRGAPSPLLLATALLATVLALVAGGGA
jgi:hypothetical protein